MMIMLMLRRAMMISSLIGGALSDKIISMVLRLSKPSLLALIKMFGNKCGAEYLICINISFVLSCISHRNSEYQW